MDLLQSFLFVPGDSSRKIASARTLRADAIILDMEDGVAPDRKHEARRMIQEELDKPEGFRAKVFVRVNCVESRFFAADICVAVRPNVHGMVLPKCNDASDVAEAHRAMLALEAQNRMPAGTVGLVPMIESAKGVAHANEIARAGLRSMAMMFGGEDFCADMGIARTREGEELTVARSLVAVAARARGLEPIDGIFADFADGDGLFADAQRARQMGFTGKTLIHPNQINVVHRAMAPGAAEISWAEEVVKAFESAGGGVVAVRGKMVDEPVVMQARKILQVGARNRDNNP